MGWGWKSEYNFIYLGMEKNINTTHNLIKPFLKSNFNKQFIYYKNPSSIKIQLPNHLTESVIDFLNKNNIKYVLEHPKFITYKFHYIKGMDVIRILFYKKS